MGTGGPGSGPDGDGPGTTDDPLVDADGDGVPAMADCDDEDPSAHPGADEVPYDGADNDCDPANPDDDLDGDGFDVDEDCDDGAADVSPDGIEVRGDGVDNDCDDATCFVRGFAATATVWPLPDGYGVTSADTPFALLASTSRDCATLDPYHSTVDLTGDQRPDLGVTLAPCGDGGVGSRRWLVYEAECDL